MKAGQLIGQLKFFSLGIVAENKKLKGDNGQFNHAIKVVPTEALPFLDGELTGQANQETVKGETSTGGSYETMLQTTNAITATWFPLGGGGNRRTSPDVRRGAIVAIYQFANADVYFWATLMDDAKFRKLETVVWGISATRDENALPGPDNMYYFEISSHTKKVTFHTSQADGEPFGYDIQLDTQYGSFQIRDTKGNIFSLDTKENRLEMINADGSFIDMNKTILKIFTKDNVEIETKNYKLNCENSDTQATAVTLKATTQDIEATTVHKGNFTLIGNFIGKKGQGGGGQGTFEGSLETTEQFSAQQGGTFGGTVKANKVISTQPIDAPNV